MKIPKLLFEFLVQMKMVELKPVPPPPPKKPDEYAWNTCCICKRTLSILQVDSYDWIEIEGIKKLVCPSCIKNIKSHPHVVTGVVGWQV